jgi:hypothetical protein
VIGSIKGSKTVVLRDSVENIIKLYGGKKYGPTMRVEFPLDDTKAMAEAYMFGLAASVLKYAPDNSSLHRASVYVLNITNEGYGSGRVNYLIETLSVENFSVNSPTIHCNLRDIIQSKLLSSHPIRTCRK